MQKLDAKKRKPVYNDRLSVLDFRTKKSKSPKLSEKAPAERMFVEFQMPSPMSSTSEGVESSKTSTPTTASPVDVTVPKTPWDDVVDVKVDADFTAEDVQNAAQLLLDAINGVTSDEEDENEIMGDLEETDDVVAVADKVRDKENDLSASAAKEDSSEAQEEDFEYFEEPPLLPAPIDDDDTDDDWRPAYKPKSVSSYIDYTCRFTD
jgi:hypothetical protein